MVAATGVDQVSIALNGKPRWNTATASATHPGGAAGTHDIWACSGPDVFVVSGSPATEADNTTHAFTLKITTSGTPSGTGGETWFRKVGTLVWSGTAITSITPLVGKLAGISSDSGGLPVGSIVEYAGSTDPGVQADGTDWRLADGRLVVQATYPLFTTRVGHKYNGGVDPGGGNIRLPDRRGRASVGADDMGTAQGAANRIPNSNRQAGQNGGEERHTNLSTESGMPAHTHGDTFAVSSVQPWSAGWNVPIADTSWQDGNVTSGNISLSAGPIPATLGAISYASGGHSHSVTGAVSTASAVNAASAHNNMQPYEVDNVIVRVA